MEINLEKAIALLKLSQYSEAEKEIKNILVNEPDFIEANVLLCHCYKELERHEEAISQADKLIELAPNWSEGYYLKARILSEFYFVRLKVYRIPQRLKEAEHYITKAINLNHENYDYWWSLAIIKFNQSICFRDNEGILDLQKVSTDKIELTNKKQISVGATQER